MTKLIVVFRNFADKSKQKRVTMLQVRSLNDLMAIWSQATLLIHNPLLFIYLLMYLFLV
jgi:hypothetical protein